MSLDTTNRLSWIYDLYRLGQAAVQDKNTAAVYQQILTHIVDGFNAKSGSLVLRDNDGSNLLTIIAGIDLPVGVVGSKVEMGEGVLGWVAEEAKALLLNGDVPNDPRFQLQHKEGGGSKALNSAICWPLEIESRVIGAISVNRSGGMMPFTKDDVVQGTALLSMASLALVNMQLHIDQKQRFEELQRVNRRLEEAQNQLMQADKMASIGQLAAGVAHEINNPIGYVYSNLGTLEKYVQDAF
ncbi:MAG: GAF domain-containing protein, partial [Nitrosomonadales bacterium]|nr:GAF domain-containing protein [Nitrosomonadales bacterium]